MLEGTEKTRFKSLVATLNCMSLDRSDVQYAAKDTFNKKANPQRLTKAAQISERGRKGDVGDAGKGTQRDARGFGSDEKGPRGSRRVEAATHTLSTAEALYYAVVTWTAEALGMLSMMTDLGTGCTGSRRGIVILVAAGGDQISKSEDEAGTRRSKLGRPFDEGKIVARDRHA